MGRIHEIVFRLTSPRYADTERRRDLQAFAEATGWVPSDELAEYPGTESFANGHLLVEHGLANSAVISFLLRTLPFEALDPESKRRVLGLSYNNLVDWHLLPDDRGLTIVYNRTRTPKPQYLTCVEHPELWQAKSFERYAARPPTPDFRALDDTLIETIRYWKKVLRSELGPGAGNAQLSALFNTLIFVRVLEDARRWQGDADATSLLGCVGAGNGSGSITAALRRWKRSSRLASWPKVVRDVKASLSVFDGLEPELLEQLIRDFYFNRFAPYDYDFSLISKHALGRIYETYVSILQETESPQLTLFKDLPEERTDRSLGTVYTPFYIARFFGRFLQEHLPPREFRRVKTVDPACGSGMFLRTLLELQCDPLYGNHTHVESREAFSHVLGVDVDRSACYATELSLTLLHFAVTREFPKDLKIHEAEALSYFQGEPGLAGCFDVVVANPPFVKWDNLHGTMRERVRQVMGDLSHGRPDLFLAFLRLGIELARENGYVLFVLPHSFLLARNASRLRRYIADTCWVHVLADLSEIPVFKGIGSYVILLVLQKRGSEHGPEPSAAIVRCREFVGRALMAALQQRWQRTDFYDVFQVDQGAFKRESWVILSREQVSVRRKVERDRHLRLGELADVRQGMVTGSDKVFIRESSGVPRGGRKVWIPFLPDRNMERYRVPRSTAKLVFYPFEGDYRLDAAAIKDRYPQTWDYLSANRRTLQSRGSAKSGGIEWWEPVRPRAPENMLRPKLVSPHLVLRPRFALDGDGKYAISRSPMILCRSDAEDVGLLKYLLAVLNSAVGYWQLTSFSHKYRSGYAMLEVKTLTDLRVPNPACVSPKVMGHIQRLVDQLIADPSGRDAEAELDRVMADLYELTTEERAEIGLEV